MRMSSLLFKKAEYPLRKLLDDIELGEIGLPELQRPFVWKVTKVRDLFDSMYRGYPIGFFLFWENAENDDIKYIGIKEKQKIPRLLIVDGQQRLTSLYAVMKKKEIIDKNHSPQRIRISFNPITKKFEVYNAAIAKDPEWTPDISDIWDEGSSIYSFVNKYISRISEQEYSHDIDIEKVSSSIERLSKLEDYPITALEISSSADEEQVSDIFVRINSKGKQLNQSDFILTLMSVFWDEGRHALEDFSRMSRIAPQDKSPSPFNFYIHPSPDQLLRVSIALAFKRARLSHVYSILRGKNLETGKFSPEQREENFALLQEAQAHVLDLKNWHEFLKTVHAAGYLSGAMITSETALIYSYAFWLIGKIEHKMSYEELRSMISRWFFMVALTGRYSSSPESTMEQDLARLRTAQDKNTFINVLNEQIDSIFTPDYWEVTLPSELDSAAARSPGQFAFYASLVLLDASVLYSNMKVSDLLRPDIKSMKSALERHHLFPRNFLKRKGITEDRMINQVANYALLEWHKNIEISDDDPAVYAPKQEEAFTEEALNKMYDLHALWNDWYHYEYTDFLGKRRKLMAGVIRRGYKQLSALEIRN